MTVNNAQKMMQKVGEVAKVGFVVHCPMCRHGAGDKLANDGQDTRAIPLYLGHTSINHTARYGALSPERCRDFWPDERVSHTC